MRETPKTLERCALVYEVSLKITENIDQKPRLDAVALTARDAAEEALKRLTAGTVEIQSCRIVEPAKEKVGA